MEALLHVFVKNVPPLWTICFNYLIAIDSIRSVRIESVHIFFSLSSLSAYCSAMGKNAPHVIGIRHAMRNAHSARARSQKFEFLDFVHDFIK